MPVIPFQVGYCPNCSMQSQVRDVRGNPVGGIVGSSLCCLQLCDANGVVKSRVGNFALCAMCSAIVVDPLNVKEALVANPLSGITGDEPEWGMLPVLKIEVLKVYK